MYATAATMCTDRPMSCNARAKLFAKELAARGKATQEPSPPQSLASSFEGVGDTTLRGELVDLKQHLAEFDSRFREPCVGEIMDTSLATQGALYTLRSNLRR